MANEYYDNTKVDGEFWTASDVESIEDGFDKLPTLTGNANKIITVNAAGTALEAKSATLSATDLNITNLTVTGLFTSVGIDDNATVGPVLTLANDSAIIGGALTQTALAPIFTIIDSNATNATDFNGFIEFEEGNTNTNVGRIGFLSGANDTLAMESDGSIQFRTGGTTNALTLGAGQLATFAGNVSVEVGTFTSRGINDDATSERIKINDTFTYVGTTAADYAILKPDTAASLIIGGGNGSDDGSNIILRGSTDTDGGDTLFRAGTETWMQWDESGGTLTLKSGTGSSKPTEVTVTSNKIICGNDLTTTFTISRGFTGNPVTGGLHINGGYIPGWGANIELEDNLLTMDIGTYGIYSYTNSSSGSHAWNAGGLTTKFQQMKLQANRLELSNNTSGVAEVFYISGNNDEGQIRLGYPFGGAYLSIFPDNNASNAGDLILRGLAGDILEWDNSAGTITFDCGPTGSRITSSFQIEANGTLNVAGVTNYETLVTADDDIPNRLFVMNEIANAIDGQHTIYMPASAMYPSTTSGASAVSEELATNDVQVFGFDFDASLAERVQFAIQMPKSWNEGTIVPQFIWKDGATAGTGNVRWAIQATAVADNDAMDVAWGTASNTVDTFLAAGDCHITAEGAAFTVAGSPGAEELVNFRVYRDAANAADTYTQDARLIGVKLHWTADAPTDD